MAAKARLYLRGGTLLVWVAWPARQAVDIWRAGNPTVRSSGARERIFLPDRPAARRCAGATLDGEDVVPGFAMPVAEVFADPLA